MEVKVNRNTLSWKCKVYDVENKELIKEFNSLTSASKFTGVNKASVLYSIRNKTKIEKENNKLNKLITFR